MVTTKQGIFTDINPYATDLKKELKNQIYEQISIIRYNFTLGNVQVIFNSVNALADIIIPFFESQNFLINYDEDNNDLSELSKKKHKSKNVTVIENFEKEYSKLLTKIRRNPNVLMNNFKYKFQFNEYLHEKFKLLIKLAISGGLIQIKKRITEDV